MKTHKNVSGLDIRRNVINVTSRMIDTIPFILQFKLALMVIQLKSGDQIRREVTIELQY